MSLASNSSVSRVTMALKSSLKDVMSNVAPLDVIKQTYTYCAETTVTPNAIKAKNLGKDNFIGSTKSNDE